VLTRTLSALCRGDRYLGTARCDHAGHKAREQRRHAIRTELKILGAQRAAAAQDSSQIRTTLWGYLEDLRAMAHQGIGEARSLLRTMLATT
jgi:hypothetical protein